MNEGKKDVAELLKEYIPVFCKGINSMVNFIHSGNEIAFTDTIVDAIDGLDWIIKAMSMTSDFYNNNEDLNSILMEIVQGMENQDYTLVADLFEYEILPKVQQWEQYLVSN